MSIDGREVVVLTPEDYAALSASRRQLGALNSHAEQLKSELRQARALLGRVREMLAPPDGERQDDGPADPAALIEAIDEAVRRGRPRR
ncbi:hypothetical protein [Kitasatospora fiedleri]|uniref:hypothetical protein n=1 Tax=Kitasatospora fiedleri TaxID=2991545 RepID=UPI00249C6022|nr:hypothetical protein [Kitasatospora fiedleri]